MEQTYTSQLAQWVAGVGYKDLPREVLHYTHLLTLDQVGCQVAGARLPWSRSTRNAILALSSEVSRSRPSAKTVVYYDKLPADDAAFVNSAFGHGTESDDTHISSQCHPGAVVIPAVLALAESRGISGERAVLAIVVGYEVAIRVAYSVSPHLMDRGHHPALAIGPFGAAAACASLLGLDQQATIDALAIAASFAGGVAEYTRSGGSAKRIHCAIGAHAGMRSAVLAENGVTGPTEPLEGLKGFCRVFADHADLDWLTAELGRKWLILETAIKPYSCQYYVHAPVQALGEILRERAISVDAIDRIVVGTSNQGKMFAGQIWRPRDVLGAQVSIAFSLAVRAIRGGNGLWDYREEDLEDPAFLSFAERVSVVVDPTAASDHPKNFGAIVRVLTTDGAEYSARLRYTKGLPQDPMTEREVRDKFRSFVVPVLGDRTERLEMAIAQLVEQAGVGEVLAAAAGGRD